MRKSKSFAVLIVSCLSIRGLSAAKACCEHIKIDKRSLKKEHNVKSLQSLNKLQDHKSLLKLAVQKNMVRYHRVNYFIKQPSVRNYG